MARVQSGKPAVNFALGYVNASGARLLTLRNDQEFTPTFLSTAICSEGREFAVRYRSFQNRKEKSNGRQSQWNFDNDEGHLYEILGTPAEANETCLLVPSGYLKESPIAPNELTKVERDARNAAHDQIDSETREQKRLVFQPSGEFARGAIKRIEEEKGRTVRQYWPMHRSGGTQEVAIVEFEPAGNDLLAAVVVVEPNRLSFSDMPAKRDSSCWRVDDDCVLALPQMGVPVAFRSPNGPVLLFTWWGAEGQSITLFQARDGKLVELANGYRYHSPV